MKIDHDLQQSTVEEDSWLDFVTKILVVLGSFIFIGCLVLVCILQALGKLPH